MQTNDVQAMLLLSERVLEMHFPANWRPKFQNVLLWYPPMGEPQGDNELNKQQRN